MVKRLAWFVVGAAAGVGGSVYAKRKVKATAERLSPRNIAGSALDTVKDAMREGRSAMRSKEVELRAVRDGHPATGTPPRPFKVVIDVGPAEAAPLRAVGGPVGPRRRARR
jgi:hypothetical protein